MRTAIVMERKRSISQAAASKRFGKYKKETEKAVRKATVKQDEKLKLLVKAWKDYECPESDPTEKACYPPAVACLEGLSYSPEDVERFSIMLSDFEEEEVFSKKAGYFLSALINNGEHKSYRIYTEHLSVPIYYFGTSNVKNITVYGNLGACAGYKMRSGSLEINGDAGGSLGIGLKGGIIIVNGSSTESVGTFMEGGTIVVQGDVKTDNRPQVVGECMQGGKITVKGNVEGLVGVDMTGGEIHLFGDFEGLGMSKGSNIYHKGKLIVDR